MYKISNIINDPELFYNQWHKRKCTYASNWQLMPMPEYENIVHKTMDYIKNICVPMEFDNMRDIALQKLVSVSLTTTTDPTIIYTGPYPNPFPYIPTLMALQGAMEFLEVVWRHRGWKNIVPMYQSDRYTHYSIYCMFDCEDTLFLPTDETLPFMAFLRVRSYNIQFIGVTYEPLFFDRFVCGPLDFWIHDLSHARRMCVYDKAFHSRRNEMKMVQKQILKIVEQSSHSVEYTTILFELVHDSALPFLYDILFNYIIRPNGSKEPFERIDSEHYVGMKNRIMVDGNVQSGAKLLRHGRIFNLHIFWHEALNTPALVANKIRHGFFDPFNAPDESIWAINKRHDAGIIQVFRDFLHDVFHKDEMFDIVESILDPKGLTQLFKYPELQSKI